MAGFHWSLLRFPTSVVRAPTVVAVADVQQPVQGCTLWSGREGITYSPTQIGICTRPFVDSPHPNIMECNYGRWCNTSDGGTKSLGDSTQRHLVKLLFFSSVSLSTPPKIRWWFLKITPMFKGKIHPNQSTCQC